jgi:hypothetical protein
MLVRSGEVTSSVAAKEKKSVMRIDDSLRESGSASSAKENKVQRRDFGVVPNEEKVC